MKQIKKEHNRNKHRSGWKNNKQEKKKKKRRKTVYPPKTVGRQMIYIFTKDT